MPKLILMRHAKSDWNTDAPTDHARPLNKRGRRDSPKIARELMKRGWTPELVLSSDSMRTRETYSLMREEFTDSGNERKIKERYLSSLYHGGISDIRRALLEKVNDENTVLILGHNPGWESALYWFSGAEEVMTTANAALLESDSWDKGLTDSGQWTLKEILRPKEI